MAVHVKWWDDTRTILHYQFVGHWTWEEYWSAIEQARKYSVDEMRVDIVADFIETGMVPGSALTHLRKAVATRPPNRGIVVVVGTNIVVRSLISMSKPLLPRAMRFDIVDTLEEALDIIYAEQQAHT